MKSDFIWKLILIHYNRKMTGVNVEMSSFIGLKHLDLIQLIF